MRKASLETFEKYLPSHTFCFVKYFLNKYSIILKLVSKRKTLLGTYSFDVLKQRHTITLNENLNIYAMFFIFLHELAHLLVEVKSVKREKPHGTIWQKEFSELLTMSIKKDFFPPQLTKVITQLMRERKLGNCTNIDLLATLREYDEVKENIKLIKDLQLKEHFKLSDGRQFVNHGKKVKRYYAQDLQTRRWYSFHPQQEVLDL